MSTRAAVFLAEWIRDNPAGCEATLVADAHQLGIGLAEFEEEVGDVGDYLRDAAGAASDPQRRTIAEEGANDA